MGRRLLTKEDIILLFLEDPKKLAYEIYNKRVPKSAEIRTLICDLGDPECAYAYAKYVDKKQTDETRQVTCKDFRFVFYYARWVDKSPRSDTRQGACKDSYWKERYEEWENSLKKM